MCSHMKTKYALMKTHTQLKHIYAYTDMNTTTQQQYSCHQKIYGCTLFLLILCCLTIPQHISVYTFNYLYKGFIYECIFDNIFVCVNQI